MGNQLGNKALAIAFVIALLCLLPLGASGQQNITVQSAQGQNPATFVLNKLAGNGVLISNVRFNGSNTNISTSQIGTFQANNFIGLYMDSGVVMTTGNISVAPGPNTDGNASQAVSSTGCYSDAQLASIATASINCCATLDFDFVSISPFITVNYCFGSEEYPEYVCSNYNDVFAFYITGLDPTTTPPSNHTWNMARIPHTVGAGYPNGVAVAINTVNPGQSGSSSGSVSGCLYNFTQYYVANNEGNTGVQYDGYTRKLSANATIVPCEQYHMHISICNVGDNAYDSGVFLESHSFNSPMAQLNLSTPTIDTIVHNHPKVVPLTVYGSDYSYGMSTLTFGGEAVCGRDYHCISSNGDTLTPSHNTVNISGAGHTLKFVGVYGRVIPHPMDIEVAVRTSLCSNYPDMVNYDTLRFVLVEDDIVALRDTTISVSSDTCLEVGVEVAVARRPLQFHWMPEDGINFPNQQYSSAFITEDRTYRVVAWDEVGNVDTATVQVLVGRASIEQVAGSEVKVYPNPTDGVLNIEASGLQQVELVNPDGIVIYSSRCSGDHATIDTAPFAAAVYSLKVSTASGVVTEKVIIR